MNPKRAMLAGFVLALFVLSFFFTNTYNSSPGYAPREVVEDFYANKPTCYGIDILLNEEATWADAPGQSLCIGYLKQ